MRVHAYALMLLLIGGKIEGMDAPAIAQSEEDKYFKIDSLFEPKALARAIKMLEQTLIYLQEMKGLTDQEKAILQSSLPIVLTYLKKVQRNMLEDETPELLSVTDCEALQLLLENKLIMRLCYEPELKRLALLKEGTKQVTRHGSWVGSGSPRPTVRASGSFIARKNEALGAVSACNSEENLWNKIMNALSPSGSDQKR